MVIIIARYVLVNGVPQHRLVAQKIPYSSKRKVVSTEQAYNKYFWRSYLTSLELPFVQMINGKTHKCVYLVYRWGNFGPDEPFHKKKWLSLYPGYTEEGKKIPVRTHGVIA